MYSEGGWVMTDTLPTQEQVDRVARELGPDVVKIEMHLTRDHDGDPMLRFEVVLSDEVAQPGKVHPVAERARVRLWEELKLQSLEDHYAIVSVRRRRAEDVGSAA